MKRKQKGSAAPVDHKPHLDRAPRERWQRGSEFEEVYTDPDSPVRTQRVFDTVAAMEREGRIAGEHVRAARTWVRDFERSMRSSYSHPATAGCGSGTTNQGPEMRLLGGIESAARLASATRAVGLEGSVMLREIVHQGRSLRSLAEMRKQGRGGLADEFVAVLEALERHYAQLARDADDRQRRQDEGRDRGREMAA